MFPIYLIGLTGGVASGKGVVSQLLQKAGVRVINLDDLGRELTQSTPILQKEIFEKFALPKWDPTQIREAVFSDPKKRKWLEERLHPLIWDRFLEKVNQWVQEGVQLAVCEAALLIESGLYKHFKELIVVTAPKELRLARLKERDKISTELAEKMIRAQWADEDKLPLATHILMNDGDRNHLKAQLQPLIEKWQLKGSRSRNGRE